MSRIEALAPATITDAQVQELRGFGYTDREIVDIVGVVALNLLTRGVQPPRRPRTRPARGQHRLSSDLTRRGTAPPTSPGDSEGSSRRNRPHRGTPRGPRCPDPRQTGDPVVVRLERAALNRLDAMLLKHRTDEAPGTSFGSYGAGIVTAIDHSALRAFAGDGPEPNDPRQTRVPPESPQSSAEPGPIDDLGRSGLLFRNTV